MLRSMKDLIGYSIVALDDVVGGVDDFYFDDATWTIRYLVVDTGSWLSGRSVLISPLALGRPDQTERETLPVNLKREQIENSPPIEADKPVSRQQEARLIKHFEWPAYWEDVTFFDARVAGMDPDTYLRSMKQAQSQRKSQAGELEQAASEQRRDPHLRSTDEVIDYHIQARDGEIGHVEDFIVDDEAWIIRYLVIDTRNWWPGKKVLVSPLWIEQIDWAQARVRIDLARETIKNGPEFDPSAPVNREYETRLYDYYGRPKYWLSENLPEKV